MSENVKNSDNHYVDNVKFQEEILKYKESVKIAQSLGKPKPQITDYLGDCIKKISERISYRNEFIMYPFKEEMILDGIENCIRYFDNFNPEAISKRTGKKTAGPFGYFSQIIYYAFVRRIVSEKKQLKIKQKYISKLSPDLMELQEVDEGDFTSSYIEYLQEIVGNDFLEDDKKKKIKKKQHLSSLDEFFEDDILSEENFLHLIEEEDVPEDILNIESYDDLVKASSNNIEVIIE